MHTTIIGLIGQAGSGKDTVADVLSLRDEASCRYAFADELKLEVARAFDAPEQLFRSPALKSLPTVNLALRNCCDAEYVAAHWGLANLDAVTPRSIMQTWGDWRRAQDPDYFVGKVNKHIRIAIRYEAEIVVVTDVRYRNEADLIRRFEGHLWRIVRPGLPRPSGHRSEWELADEPVDAEIVNDGSVEQLAKIATDLLLNAQALDERPRHRARLDMSRGGLV